MEYINLELLNCFLIYYLHKSKFLSCYTVRYHRCCAPRYRLDVVGLLPLAAASYHTRPWRNIIQCFNGQHILQGFVEPDAMDVRVAALLYALLPQASHAVCIVKYTQILPVQPWLETALEGIRMCSLEHKNRGPILQD